MTEEENKAVVRRFYEEVVNRQQFDVLDELCAPDFEGFKDEESGDSVDREGFKQVCREVRESFPDMEQTTDDLIAGDDKVVARFTIRGTHTGGPFIGIPATGKKVTLRGIDVWRVRDGKLTEQWLQGDFLGTLQQIGVIPQDVGELATRTG